MREWRLWRDGGVVNIFDDPGDAVGKFADLRPSKWRLLGCAQQTFQRIGHLQAAGGVKDLHQLPAGLDQCRRHFIENVIEFLVARRQQPNILNSFNKAG